MVIFVLFFVLVGVQSVDLTQYLLCFFVLFCALVSVLFLLLLLGVGCRGGVGVLL